MCLCRLATTQVEANLVYTVRVDENEVVIEGLLGKDAMLANGMSELDVKTQLLE
jgi:hypothetical protein